LGGFRVSVVHKTDFNKPFVFGFDIKHSIICGSKVHKYSDFFKIIGLNKAHHWKKVTCKNCLKKKDKK